jgi:hypothetical protein
MNGKSLEFVEYPLWAKVVLFVMRYRQDSVATGRWDAQLTFLIVMDRVQESIV